MTETPIQMARRVAGAHRDCACEGDAITLGRALLMAVNVLRGISTNGTGYASTAGLTAYDALRDLGDVPVEATDER